MRVRWKCCCCNNTPHSLVFMYIPERFVANVSNNIRLIRGVGHVLTLGGPCNLAFPK